MNIDSLVKELEMMKGKNYDISYDLEPIIQEYKYADGTGKRYVYYKRTITITDKEPTFEENIKHY